LPDLHVDHLLVGGGLASANCAEALREGGADGSILIVGRELDPPYDRPPCSKGYLQGKQTRDETLLHPDAWYESQQIEVVTRTTVTALDPGERVAKLSDHRQVGFGQALIATGSGVRRLTVPGSELDGIQYLRTIRNSDTIRQDAAGKRVVLIGGSYIGSEVAATLTELGSRCTIVMLEEFVLSRGFGDQGGRFFQGVLEDHGITVHGGQSVARFEGAGGRINRVVTDSGLELEADAVVIGIGAVPDVTLARAAGLEVGEAGGVRVDSRLQTPVPGVYVAGDIAEYDSVVHGGRTMRIEHWDVAFNQGRTAARNMLGHDVAHDVVPYFFSDLSDWTWLEYVGPASHWDREVVRGSLDEGEFTIFYLDDARVVAALTVGRSDDLETARRLLAGAVPLDDAGIAALGDLSSDLERL